MPIKMPILILILILTNLLPLKKPSSQLLEIPTLLLEINLLLTQIITITIPITIIITMNIIVIIILILLPMLMLIKDFNNPTNYYPLLLKDDFDKKFKLYNN